MDLWLVKINAALDGTAIPAVLIFVAATGWLVLRWDRNPSKSKRRAFALAGAAGAYVLLLSGTTATVNSLAFKRFLSLEHHPVWAAYPESGAPRELAYLRQFRSEELPDWLQRLAEAAGANQPLQRTATALPAR